MTPYALCLLATIAVNPLEPSQPSVFRHAAWEAAVRGQSPYYDEPATAEPTYTAPPSGSPILSPFSPPSLPQDPFLAPGTATAAPWTPSAQLPFGTGYVYGPSTPHPYRLGWMPFFDLGYVSQEGTNPPSRGEFEILEAGTAFQYTAPVAGDWLFLTGPEFAYRSWEGPQFIGLPALGLPSSVYHIGWNFALATANPNRDINYYFSFNPSVNSDFQQDLSSDAYNWDGVGIVYWRVLSDVQLALGAGYWDRVRDRIIPYAGVIWTPNPAWEFRLMFPRSRISYSLGKIGEGVHWLYLNGEYHVEAYEVMMQPAGFREKIELQDWRVTLGVESAHPSFTKFLEAGFIFGRHARFNNAVPDFNLGNGFIARAGIRF